MLGRPCYGTSERALAKSCFSTTACIAFVALIYFLGLNSFVGLEHGKWIHWGHDMLPEGLGKRAHRIFEPVVNSNVRSLFKADLISANNLEKGCDPPTAPPTSTRARALTRALRRQDKLTRRRWRTHSSPRPAATAALSPRPLLALPLCVFRCSGVFSCNIFLSSPLHFSSSFSFSSVCRRDASGRGRSAGGPRVLVRCASLFQRMARNAGQGVSAAPCVVRQQRSKGGAKA